MPSDLPTAATIAGICAGVAPCTVIAIGESAPAAMPAAASWSRPVIAGPLPGMFLASASPGLSEIAGIITTTTMAMPSVAITPAWWVTRRAHRAHGPTSGSACEMKRRGITRTRLMPVPMIASMAGSSVQAAITDTIGISNPATPIERMNGIGRITMLSSPIPTVEPDTTTDLPAWIIVSTSACSVERPAASSSRKRKMNRSE